MNWITIGAGVLALLYGFYTLYARLRLPHHFGKLETMRQTYGQRTGTIVHVVSYTLMPLLFGAIMIAAGLRGVSLLG